MLSMKTITRKLALVAITSLLAATSFAQSARPGMGAIPYDGGVTFRVWAPGATTVTVAGDFNSFNTTNRPLVFEPGSPGIWSVDVPGATANQEYKFLINGAFKKDPQGRLLRGGFNNSVVYDRDAFDWDNVTPTPPPFFNESVIYEMHIGSFNRTGSGPGTFDTAIQRLDHLVDIGVNVVKVMPVKEFPGDFSWGYNPSDPFAVERAYGGPDGFKRFVRECHRRGLAVVLDVVHNHYGPNDLDIWNFVPGVAGAPYTPYFPTDAAKRETPFGSRVNFEEPEIVNYIRDNTRMWLDEYRVQGFRWDATVLMRNINLDNNSPGYDAGMELLRNVNSLMNIEYPGFWKISEDLRNDPFLTNPVGPGGLGFDSDWWSGFYFIIRDALYSTSDGDRNMSSIQQAVTQSNIKKTIYLQSHDEVSNDGGDNNKFRVTSNIDFGNPTGYFARKRASLGATVTLTSPGLPMIFMGEELLMTGGWNDQAALNWNNLTTHSGFVSKYRDMIRLRRNLDGVSQGLKGPNTNFFLVDNTNKVVAYHRWDQGSGVDDVIVVMNFSNTARTGYQIGLPYGGFWYTHYNSDSTLYYSDYDNVGTSIVEGNGGPLHGLGQSGTFDIGRYSALILSRQQQSTVGHWTMMD